MKRLLSILLAFAGCAFAGPNVRVIIDGQGNGADLVAQAYEVRLRNIPGIVVVPFGDPADLVIQLSCLIARAENRDVGYVWSEVALDAKTGVELQGPSIFAVGGASARQPWLLFQGAPLLPTSHYHVSSFAAKAPQ